jgi:hypothetical protein
METRRQNKNKKKKESQIMEDIISVQKGMRSEKGKRENGWKIIENETEINRDNER